jgi:hypothetical protein
MMTKFEVVAVHTGRGESRRLVTTVQVRYTITTTFDGRKRSQVRYASWRLGNNDEWQPLGKFRGDGQMDAIRAAAKACVTQRQVNA